MNVSISQRRVRKYFSDRMTIEDAEIPVPDNKERELQTIDAYKAILEKPLQFYTNSQLPFKAKFVWNLETSKHGEDPLDQSSPATHFAALSTDVLTFDFYSES